MTTRKKATKKTTTKTRRVRAGSLRWFEQEWTRLFYGKVPAEFVRMLAQQSYEIAKLRERLNALEERTDAARHELDGVALGVDRHRRNTAHVLDRVTRLMAEGPPLPWAKGRSLLGRPN